MGDIRYTGPGFDWHIHYPDYEPLPSPPDGTRGPQGVWRGGKFWFGCSLEPILPVELLEAEGMSEAAIAHAVPQEEVGNQ